MSTNETVAKPVTPAPPVAKVTAPKKVAPKAPVVVEEPEEAVEVEEVNPSGSAETWVGRFDPPLVFG